VKIPIALLRSWQGKKVIITNSSFLELVDPYLAEELLIGIILLLSGAILGRVIPTLFEWMHCWIRKLRWKACILEEYPNRDLIVKLKQGSEVKILGKKHKVSGFIVADHMGEISYSFWLTANNLQRWLEFDENKIIVWGEWLDPDLWGNFGKRQEQPQPVLVKTVEELKTSPILEVGDIRAKIIDKRSSSRIQVIWGRWTKDAVYKNQKLKTP